MIDRCDVDKPIVDRLLEWFLPNIRKERREVFVKDNADYITNTKEKSRKQEWST